VRKLAAVARRELAAYFNPRRLHRGDLLPGDHFAWFFYGRQFLSQNTASLRDYFSLWPFAFIILLPALTMRSWPRSTGRAPPSCS